MNAPTSTASSDLATPPLPAEVGAARCASPTAHAAGAAADEADVRAAQEGSTGATCDVRPGAAREAGTARLLGGFTGERRWRAPDQAQAASLARMVTAFEHWRLFPDLRGGARFVDIETGGLDEADPITLVGISDGHHVTVLVRGRDLTRRRLADELVDAKLLVTFNGAAFDLPRLRAAFPGLPWDLPHFDLARPAARSGSAAA